MISLILAGGSGTRLFPLSRKNYPKQFFKFSNNMSLFQETIKRNMLVTDVENMIILTNNAYKFHILNQLNEILPDKRVNIILEPTARNTAPAIALAVVFAIEKLEAKEDDVLFISPSDHIFKDENVFAEAVKKAEKIAKDGYIVTFGINPARAETGYGYIEADESIKSDAFYKVAKFHEKPDVKTVQKYIEKGNYYWNSGMFVVNIGTFIDELKKHAADIYDKISNRNFEDVLNDFESMPNISIDYAIMEKTDKAVVLPLNTQWSDVGCWDSFYDISQKDDNNNVLIGTTVAMNTKDSLVLSDKRLIAAVGIEDAIVVETGDVVLVAKKGKSQKIKELVEKIKQDEKLKNITDYHTTVYRPWGSYTELEQSDRYKIKKIIVKPKEALSLQLHYHRSEHWVVVKGTAKVTLEDETGKLNEYFIHENESIYVPKTRKHRIENPGKVDLEIIETQVGEYVGEDDIVRFEDRYER